MSQIEYTGPGSLDHLSGVLEENNAERVLLITGKNSYDKTGIGDRISHQLQGLNVVRFSDFDTNPKIQDLITGIQQLTKMKFDTIIAVGGGSVLDMAKLISFFRGKDEAFIERFLQGDESGYQPPKSKLIAIPTTAGTGSEATEFAVLYDREKTKHSVAHHDILPDTVFLDAHLLDDISIEILGPTILDSFCQCIESYWSVNATPESQEDARKGLEILAKELQNIHAGSILSIEVRQRLLQAANFSGKGINISKTTACHAVSYPITSHFGVPHGHAVSLTLGGMFLYNQGINAEECLDARGVEYVQKTLQEILDILGLTSGDEFVEYVQTISHNLGLPYRLSSLGIQLTDLDIIIENGFNPGRVKNNPRELTQKPLRDILEYII